MNEVHEQQPQTEVKNPGKAAKATPLVLSLSFHGGLLVLLGGAALVPAYVQKPEMVAQIVQTAPVPEAPPEAAFEEPAAGSPTETAEAGGEAALESDLPPLAVDVVTSANTAVPSAWFSQPGATELRGVASIGGGGQTAGGGRGVPGGKGRGTVTLFGSSEAVGGELVGTLYDLKQTPKKERTTVSASNYAQEIKKIIDAGFDPRVFRNYFSTPNPLYLTQLYIPTMRANEAPKAFGVEKEMAPSLWVIHYTGSVLSPVTGRLRFAGYADDVLVVAVNGRVVLNGSRPDTEGIASWKPSEPGFRIANGTGYYGDWIPVSVGQSIRLDILLGERPGGDFNGFLFIQEQGKTYAKDDSGRLILPLFRASNSKIDAIEMQAATGAPAFAEKGPVFGQN